MNLSEKKRKNVLPMDNRNSYTLREAFSFKNNAKSILLPSNAPHAQQSAALDGLRALVVLWVLFHHFFLTIQTYVKDPQLFRDMVDTTPPWLSIVWHGELGVDIFFVLSGFLIGSSLMRDYVKFSDIRVKRFYANRFLRLMPTYIFALLFFLPLLPHKESIWANLIYISNYLPFDDMYMPWSWSLMLQEQFYFILPIFLLFFLYPIKNKLLLLVGLIGLSSAIRYFIQLQHPEMNSIHPANYMFFSYPGFTPEYFDRFYTGLHVKFGPLFIGVLGAYLNIYHKQKLQAVFESSWLGQGIILSAFAYITFNLSIPYYDIRQTFSEPVLVFINVFSYNLFAMSVLIIVLASLYPKGIIKPVRWFLSMKVWYPVAQTSFAVYLFHMLFVAIGCQAFVAFAQNNKELWTNGALPHEWAFLFGIGSYVLSALFCFVICLLIERPFMNFRKFQWFKNIDSQIVAPKPVQTPVTQEIQQVQTKTAA